MTTKIEKYAMIERIFITALDNVKKLPTKDVVDKLRSANKLSESIKDLANVCFAYLDLYFTELINRKFPFRDETIAEFKKKKIMIREKNIYARLVGIFNDTEDDKKITQSIEQSVEQSVDQSVEPPGKKMNLKSNCYEAEWVDWIIKNQEYVVYFNPFVFEKTIEKL